MGIERSAPGKVILCGEHSVVYGYPAIAVPVSDLRTRVNVKPQQEDQGLQICAVDLGQVYKLNETPANHPITLAVHRVLETMQCAEPDALLTIETQIPIASGMGSGAAVTVAVIRALSAFLGKELDNSSISNITFEVEKIYHGSPSGIDNTVITWEHPIYFIKGMAPCHFNIGAPFHLLIASSGISSSTRKAVNDVHARWAAKPQYFDTLFKQISDLTNTARTTIIEGDMSSLGDQLKHNQILLVELGVSIPKLDAMVDAAHQAGALGAKLTGSGLGGNIIALVEKANIEAVRQALYRAGSTCVWQTCIGN